MKKSSIVLLLLIVIAGTIFVTSSTNIVELGEDLKDYHTEIARGNVAGQSSIFKFGRSEAITSTESVIWDGGGDYTFLDNAEKMTIVSTSTDDTFGGSGAWNLLIQGLDENYTEITEVINLSGTTEVNTTQEFLRLNRMLVINSGTNSPTTDANQGIVSATGSETSILQAQIKVNNGQTLMAIFTTPAGKTGYVTGLSLSTGQGKQVFYRAKIRNGKTNGNAFSIKFTMDMYENNFFGTLVVPLKVPEKTDVVITGTTTSGSVDGSASFGMILIEGIE